MHYLEVGKEEFNRLGYTVLRNILPRGTIKSVVDTLLASPATGYVDVDLEPDAATLTFGGITRYGYFNYPDLLKYCSVVQGWYEAILPLASFVVSDDLILSPYYDSSVLALVYKDNAGQQEYHYDTQPITVLVYLTNNSDCGQTRISKGGELIDVYPEAGSILVMKGRELLHCSMPVTHGLKVSMPMNMYTTTDVWRPEALEDTDYWVKRKKRI